MHDEISAATPTQRDLASTTNAEEPLIELTERQLESIARRVPGGAGNVQAIYPLSPLQEGMLFHRLLNDTRDTYVLSYLFELQSRDDLEPFVAALQKVIDRHEILRVAVLWEGLPAPVQVVHRHATLRVDDLAIDWDRDPVEQLTLRMRPEHQQLDLRRAPLMELQVARHPTHKCHVLLRVHHLLCDDRSLRILVDEAMACLAGRQDELPAPAPFKTCLQQVLSRRQAADEEAFFRRKLGDIDEPTALFGRRDVRGNSEMNEARADLDAGLASEIRAQSRRCRVSPARLMHAAWSIVVAHVCGRDDVVFGTVLMAPSQKKLARALGLSVNTLPLRLRLAGVSAVELLEQTDRELSELLAYSQAPLALAQRCSAVAGQAPLFTALFNYRNNRSTASAETDDRSPARIIARGEAWTNYPVTMTVDDFGQRFAVTAHSVDGIDPDLMIDWLRMALLAFVEALAQASSTPVLALAMLPQSERRRVIEVFNATATMYPRDKLVHELVEEQVRLRPQSAAVVFEEEVLLYADLDSRAEQLARRLRARGVGPDRLVGICLERSPLLVIAVLAVLKAGGAYVPLDPSYPPERLQYMLSDAAPSIVLTQSSLAANLAGTSSVALALDAEGKAGSEPQDGGEPIGLCTENLAYVIYTSGSTGRPKGTAMPHRALVNLITWHHEQFGSAEGQAVLQFAALSFDVAFQEIFSTLCTGGTLVLLNEQVRHDPRALARLLNVSKVQRLFLPPIALQSLAEHCVTRSEKPAHLRDVIVAGEQLRVSPEMRELFARLDACRLHNHYGPTETHVVTALTLSGHPDAWPTLPSIGRPIANSRVYVLDSGLQPVATGVVGEIYIGGVGVARGYLHRPDLTAQRFLPDPFSGAPDARMYKTGDLGRWCGDGTLEYLGRNDDQVKIRGFRVELAEIEMQLAQHPQVKEAAVVARENSGGQRYLAGYITARGDAAPTASELRAHAKRALPEHMVPSAFVVLAALPLTPSGKLDRRSLPAPPQEAYPSRSYEAPRGAVECWLAAIWQELLGLQNVGRHDDFFELGGHSLVATRVVVRIQESLGVELPVRALFDAPTLLQLAALIAEELIEPMRELGIEDDDLVIDLLCRIGDVDNVKRRSL